MISRKLYHIINFSFLVQCFAAGQNQHNEHSTGFMPVVKLKKT